MKTTRREMAAAALAALALKGAEQDADIPKLVHDANQRNSDTLTKFEIPIGTEPAFRFEP